MVKKYIGIVIFLTLFLTPFCITFAQASNAGFIPGNIWYSKDPFEEEDKVKIYTLIYNPDQNQLSGTVFFFDKTTLLGSKDFTVPGKEIQDVVIDWTVTVGEHTIFGQIQNAKFLISGDIYQDASLSETKTSESKRSVSKKITSLASDILKKDAIPQENTDTSDSGVISNIQSFVKKNTPEVVSNVINKTTSTVEGFRENTGTLLENKKEEIKKDVESLENEKISLNSQAVKKDQNMFLRLFKYVELFALSLSSAIFNNKYIFYGLIAIIVFFVLRFIIRRRRIF